jgi:hypothetical protein
LGVDGKRQNVIQFPQNKERYSSLYGMVVQIINNRKNDKERTYDEKQKKIVSRGYSS